MPANAHTVHILFDGAIVHTFDMRSTEDLANGAETKVDAELNLGATDDADHVVVMSVDALNEVSETDEMISGLTPNNNRTFTVSKQETPLSV